MKRLIRKADEKNNNEEVIEESVQKSSEEKKKTKGDYYWNTREMVDKNKRLFEEGKINKCRFFEFKGYKIFNPFKDETGKKKVDPKEYYGEAYENSEFNKVN